MANHDHLVTVGTQLADLNMNLGHQRAGCVKDLQLPLLGVLTHLHRDPMGTHDHAGAQRHLVQIFHKDCALVAQIIHDMVVVNDFMPNVDGRTELFKGTLHNFNGTLHACAKSPRFCQHHVVEFFKANGLLHASCPD